MMGAMGVIIYNNAVEAIELHILDTNARKQLS